MELDAPSRSLNWLIDFDGFPRDCHWSREIRLWSEHFLSTPATPKINFNDHSELTPVGGARKAGKSLHTRGAPRHAWNAFFNQHFRVVAPFLRFFFRMLWKKKQINWNANDFGDYEHFSGGNIPHVSASVRANWNVGREKIRARVGVCQICPCDDCNLHHEEISDMKAATQPAKLRRFDLCDVGQVVESLSKLFAVPIVPPSSAWRGNAALTWSSEIIYRICTQKRPRRWALSMMSAASTTVLDVLHDRQALSSPTPQRTNN